ncbi:MAG TPA: hypothetical protein VJ276_25590 [Thermoanaerobaculia bacterium]|nr:hypothetical protein [Thermoanaerobaculia bacterium]
MAFELALHCLLDRRDFRHHGRCANNVIMRSGWRAVSRGRPQPSPAVRITPLCDATEATRSAGGSVTFEPGARSACHSLPRDLSLVTVAALVAGYRTNELPFHLKRALDNGGDEGRADRNDHAPRLLLRVADGEFSAAPRGPRL